MKEHLWSINICIDDADWQMNQDGSKSPPGERLTVRPNLAQKPTLNSPEHYSNHII